MARQPLQAMDLIPPPDFPSQSHDALHEIVRNGVPDGETKKQFGRAQLAVAFRFQSLARAQDALYRSIAKYGTGPARPIRSRQEEALFTFFGSAVSVFDAFHFGMFALGACKVPAAFPFTTQAHERAVNSGSTRSAYGNAFPGDPIIQALDDYKNDQVIKEIVDLRNVLTHRITFSRAHHMVSNGNDWTAWGNHPMSRNMLDAWRQAVSNRLHALMGAAVTFAHQQFP
jgi:hypothetical protein